MRQQEGQSQRWLPWAQAAWIVIVSATLLMYAAGSVLYYGELRQVCAAAAEQCALYDYATPSGVAQLAVRGLSLETYALLRVGFRIVFGLIPFVFGLYIFARRRSEPMAVLVSFFLCTGGMAGEAHAVLAGAYPMFVIPTTLIEWIGAGVVLPLFFGIFPNGRMVPRLYWAIVAYFSVGYFVQATLGFVDINSPLGTFWGWTGWLLVLLGGTAAQIYRYLRISTPIERQQTRWVLFGLGVMAAILITFLTYIAISGDSTMGSTSDPDLPRRLVFLVMINVALELIFLSIGMAVLRSKLFNIDVIIRKTLIYSTLTVALALVYFGMVLLLQSVFESISGQGSPVALVISTLVIAALFAPLRKRVQDFTDRRFFRKKYNAQRVMDQFSRTARDEVSLEALTAELTQVLQETMQPMKITLWLKQVSRPGSIKK